MGIRDRGLGTREKKVTRRHLRCGFTREDFTQRRKGAKDAKEEERTLNNM